MKTSTWSWKSKAHPNWTFAFMFDQQVSEKDAKILIRNYWNMSRLPTGFTLRPAPTPNLYQWLTDDIKSVPDTTCKHSITMILARLIQ